MVGVVGRVVGGTKGGTKGEPRVNHRVESHTRQTYIERERPELFEVLRMCAQIERETKQRSLERVDSVETWSDGGRRGFCSF